MDAPRHFQKRCSESVEYFHSVRFSDGQVDRCALGAPLDRGTDACIDGLAQFVSDCANMRLRLSEERATPFEVPALALGQHLGAESLTLDRHIPGQPQRIRLTGRTPAFISSKFPEVQRKTAPIQAHIAPSPE